MVDNTLTMAAKKLEITVDALLKDLKQANIKIGRNDVLDAKQKQQLLGFLKQRLSADGSVSVSRTKTQELPGKSKVKVEVTQVRKIVRKTVEVAPKTKKPADAEKVSQPVEDKKPESVDPAATNDASTTVESEQSKKPTAAAKKKLDNAGLSFAEPKKPNIEPIKAKIHAPKVTEEETTTKKRISAGRPQSQAHVKTDALKTTKAKELAIEEERKKKKMQSPRANALENRTMDKYKNYLSAMDDEYGSGSGYKGPKKKNIVTSSPRQEFTVPADPIVYSVEVGETINISELAQKMSVKSAEVVKVLFKLGVVVTANDSIDQDTAIIAVEEMGHKPVLEVGREEAFEDQLIEAESDVPLTPRAPVVTVMGHVDHGKTTLLDYIRKTKVADKEHGGITQHLSAYHVDTPNGAITFVDTPGHSAFTAMRSRGAQFTDIVILIVAAEDGVKPQTLEIIQHVKAAKVPIVVAVNKIDKPEANVEKVTQELAQLDLLPEAWGGDVSYIPISAMTGQGVDQLLESLLLQAELLELKSRTTGRATGIVLECRLDKGRGIIANVLVQNGELKVGDTILVGRASGRVRALLDENLKPLKKAGSSLPVELLGLTEMPEAGDKLVCVENEKQAKEMAEIRRDKERQELLRKQNQLKLDNLFGDVGEEGETEKTRINLVIKTDTHGSLEAMQETVAKMGNDAVEIEVVGYGIGGIRESDATLAMAYNGIIIGFNVRADSTARKVIERNNIDVRYYSIIYEAVDQIKQAIEGRLDPEVTEEIIGIAEVRDVFRAPKIGQIAGCMVIEGLVKRNNPIRVLRDDVVIYEGVLESLRRMKDDVSEVRNATECGIGVKNYNDVKKGDKIEVFERTEVKRTL